jgi:PEP-CTERM motif
MRIASLSLLALCLAVVPAMAQNTVYDNGPIDGNTDAWTINFGFVVSDSFTLDSHTPITGLSFGSWMFEGDVLQTADVSITSDEFGGTTFYTGTVNLTQSGCVANGFGFNVCTETGSFSGPSLNAGTYWLNLQNAVVSNGDPVYWDENGGASSGSENSVGTIPSEAFTLMGTGAGTGTGTGTGTGPGTTPEPSSIMLFGSGILGLAGVLRRKLF